MTLSRIILATVALLLGAVGAGTASHGASPQRECGDDSVVYSAGRVKYRTHNGPTETTSSDALVDLTDAFVSFVAPPGLPPRCVIVQFSAWVNVPQGSLIFVRAVLNGRKIADPGGILYTDARNGVAVEGAASFEFLFNPVATGKKQELQIQWATNGQPASIEAWSLTVFY